MIVVEHIWSVDVKQRRYSCQCGSYIEISSVGTGWEPHAVNCLDRYCRAAWWKQRDEVRAHAAAMGAR